MEVTHALHDKGKEGRGRDKPSSLTNFSFQRNKGNQHLLWTVGTWPSDRNAEDGTSLKMRLQVTMNLWRLRSFLHDIMPGIEPWKDCIGQDEEHLNEGA